MNWSSKKRIGGDRMSDIPGVEKKFLEKNMHSLFAKFLRAQSIFPKTINANKSSNSVKGDLEWTNPDIVSVEVISSLYSEKNQSGLLIEKIRKISTPQIRIVSYELKLDLRLSDLKQKYFQAVSNSSWANKGYLVVLDVDDSDEMKKELERLVKSFGIGIYVFNKNSLEEKVDNKDLFYIYEGYESVNKNVLEFDFIKKLYESNNRDFIDFLNATYSLNDSIGDKVAFESISKAQFDDCSTFYHDMELVKEYFGILQPLNNFKLDFSKSLLGYEDYKDFDWMDEDWTSKSFRGLQYAGKYYSITSGNTMYLTICSILYSLNKNVFDLYNKQERGVTKKRVDFAQSEELFTLKSKSADIPETPYLADINIANNVKRDRLKELMNLIGVRGTNFKIFIS